MSQFIGPGAYTIVAPYVEKRLDLENGRRDDGTKLQLFKPLDDAKYGPDQRFVFAHVGDNEYLIINVKSGTYLTASNDDSQMTANLISPLEKRVRWKITPVKDHSGTYSIWSAAFPKKVIDVAGSGGDDKTPILTWTSADSKNQQFFLRAAY